MQTQPRARGGRWRSWRGDRHDTIALAIAVAMSPAAANAGSPRAAEGSDAVAWPDDAADVPTTATGSESPAPPTTAPPSSATPPTTSKLPAAVQPATDDTPRDPAPLEDEGETRTVIVSSMFDGATVPRIAGSAHVVSERELQRREYDDIGRIVASVPGVYVRTEDGFGLRPNIGLRGANPDRSAKITLMEDGILLGPAPYSAPAAYYFPLPTRMTGVEVFKGPASVKYGPNTIGGAINLRTRDVPSAHASTIDLAGGRFGYFKGHAFYGTTYKGFGVLIEAARVQTQGFKELDGGGDTGFAKNDGMLKLSYENPWHHAVRHRVEAKLGYATEDSDETYLGLARSDFDASPYRRYRASAMDNMQWWRSQAELAYVLKQGEAIEFDVRLYRHDFDRLWRRLDSMRGAPLSSVLGEPTAGDNETLLAILRGEQDGTTPEQALLVANNHREFVSQGIQTAFRWRPRWTNVEQDLEIGARVHHDYIDRHHTADAFQMTSGSLVPEGSARETTTSNRGATVAAAVHLFDSITLWRRLTIAPGIRLELIDMRYNDRLIDESNRRRDVAVSPGIGALVMATTWLGVFGGAHRGFSPVTPGQPEAVKAETSMNYELGARARAKGFSGEAVGFVSDYRNLNAVCTFSSGCIDGDGAAQYNAGAVLVWGAESLARYRRAFAKRSYFELGANYTYTGSSFREAFSSSFPQWGDVERGDHLPYVPQHVVGGSAAIGGERWEISAAPSFNSVMRDVVGKGPIPDDERIDGFFLLDVSAQARPIERLTTYLQLTNVTNNAYAASFRPFGWRPGAPLTFILGVKVDVF